MSKDGLQLKGIQVSGAKRETLPEPLGRGRSIYSVINENPN